jgi:hypothetical protein
MLVGYGHSKYFTAFWYIFLVFGMLYHKIYHLATQVSTHVLCGSALCILS